MYAATGVQKHGHIRIIDLEPVGTQFGNQVLAGLGRKHPFIAQRNHVAAQRHGVFEADRDDFDLLAFEPVDDVIGRCVQTHGGQLRCNHAHHQIDVDVEVIDRRVVNFPAFFFHPGTNLSGRDLFTAQARITDHDRTGLDNVEVAAFEITG